MPRGMPEKGKVPLPIDEGGTGATSARDARIELQVAGVGDDNVWTGLNEFTATLRPKGTVELYELDQVYWIKAGFINSLDLPAPSAGRVWTLPDDTGDVVVACGAVDLTGQTASIGATSSYTAPHAGIYLIAGYLKVTTAGAAGTVTVNIAWNDGAAQNENVINAFALTVGNANQQISRAIYLASGQAVSYSTTLVGVVGAPVYDLRLRAVALG